MTITLRVIVALSLVLLLAECADAPTPEASSEAPSAYAPPAPNDYETAHPFVVPPGVEPGDALPPNQTVCDFEHQCYSR
jgi:hypothetical protein